jgi:hypothetical protein
MLYADTYLTTARVRLATLAPLPEGWSIAKPTRISAWYDSLMSRWLDDEVLARRPADAGALPAAWDLRFRGATVLLYGESPATGGRLKVLVDGQVPAATPWNQQPASLDCRSPFGETIKLAAVLAVGLDPTVEHHLHLEPFEDRPGAADWLIESICVAGAAEGGWRRADGRQAESAQVQRCGTDGFGLRGREGPHLFQYNRLHSIIYG